MRGRKASALTSRGQLRESIFIKVVSSRSDMQCWTQHKFLQCPLHHLLVMSHQPLEELAER